MVVVVVLIVLVAPSGVAVAMLSTAGAATVVSTTIGAVASGAITVESVVITLFSSVLLVQEVANAPIARARMLNFTNFMIEVLKKF